VQHDRSEVALGTVLYGSTCALYVEVFPKDEANRT
jgi:hypothetical protein